MKTIKDIYNWVKTQQPLTVAVAGISEEELLIVKTAEDEKIANFILIDDKVKIKALIAKLGISINASIKHTDDVHKAPQIAVELVKSGKADLPMKGQIHTGTFLKAVLDKEKGFCGSRRISQMTVFDGYNGELQFVTDSAINIHPNLEVKIDIINNAVEVFGYFSDQPPLVALLGAVETVSPNMPDSIDSAVITQMNRRGQITGCIIDGPLSLDNAISEKFAKIKGIDSPVAGKAQILVSAFLQEANSLSKAIVHYAKIDAASVIAGTTSPIVMTSRTDTPQNKLNTIAVTCYMNFVSKGERK